MKKLRQGTNLKPILPLVAVFFFVCGFLSYPRLMHDVVHLEPPVTSSTVISPESLKVCFTPNQSCLSQILKAINEAKTSIMLLGYSFTSKPITNALIQAKKRGVNIRIVLDHGQKSQKHSKEIIHILGKENISLRFDHSVKIAHNKVMIIDNHLTLTGSYNWTHSAEFNNAENLIFIESQEIAKKYLDYFEARWQVSRSR